MWETRRRFPRTVGSGVCFHQSVISTAVCGCLRFFFGFFGLFDSVARDVELEDDAVVDKAVNHCCRGHGMFEDSFPFGERQIAGDENAATLVTFCQRREQYFSLTARGPYECVSISHGFTKTNTLLLIAGGFSKLKLPMAFAMVSSTNPKGKQVLRYRHQRSEILIGSMRALHATRIPAPVFSRLNLGPAPSAWVTRRLGLCEEE